MSLATPRKGYKSVPWLFGKEIEIPEEWKLEQLEKFSNITMGMSPSSESYNENQEGLPFYQGIADFGENYPNTTMWCSDPKKIAEKDQILFSVRAPVGETNITNEQSCLGRGVCSINPLDNELMYCYFLISYFKKQFVVYAQGTTYDAINRNEIARTKLPFTSNKNEQQKIATILSNVDNLIESTGKVITHSKKVKKGLMQKLLTRGIGHTKFKKITLGLRYMKKEIPLDWEVVKIGNRCESIVSGRNKPEKFDGQIPWLTTDDFDQFYVEESKKNLNVSEIELKEKSGKIIPANSVLIACVGDLGLIGINKIKVSMNQQLHAFVCPKEIVPYFLAQYLSTMKNYMKAIATTTTLPYMNKENCESIVIVIPPLPEQQKIATILSNIDSKITSQEQYKEKLEKLKKSLMQKLLTGEVRV